MSDVALCGVVFAVVALMLVVTGVAARRSAEHLHGLAAVFGAIAAVMTALLHFRSS
jgi:hypothetical protein